MLSIFMTVRVFIHLYLFQRPKDMWGTEKDIVTLKHHGLPGDFIIFEKKYASHGSDSAIRIAFLKCDEDTNNESVARKIRVIKTETQNRGKMGYCMEQEPNKWFDSIDMLVNSCKNNPSYGFQTPFNVSVYSTRIISEPPLSPPGDQKQMFRSISKSESEYITKPPARKLKPNDKLSQSMKHLDIGNDHEIDRVIYEEDDPQSLLSGQPEGTFIIHKGRENKELNPFSIYLNGQYMNKEGKLRIKKIIVHKNQEDGTLSLSSDKSNTKYYSLKEVISRNRSMFKHPLKEPSTVPKLSPAIHSRPIKEEYMKIPKPVTDYRTLPNARKR